MVNSCCAVGCHNVFVKGNEMKFSSIKGGSGHPDYLITLCSGQVGLICLNECPSVIWMRSQVIIGRQTDRNAVEHIQESYIEPCRNML